LQGPGSGFNSIVVTATTACHGWRDHPGYAKYMSTTNLGATFFNIVGNVEDENRIHVVNCQLGQEIPVVGGGAQWGGTKTLTCAMTDDIGPGSVAVSEGVSVVPDPVIPNHDFNVNFTLQETNGWSISFEQIAIAILRADGSYVCDFPPYSNVYFEPMQTKVFASIGHIDASNPPGTYKAVVRYRYGGNWYDFGRVGGGVNPRSFTLLSAPVGLVLSSVKASADHGYVTLSWQTGVDVPASSFLIRRAESADGMYSAVDAPVTRGAGSSFSCTDRSVLPGKTYWYQIVLRSPSGDEAYGPIGVYVEAAPIAYRAYESYPNPFNPMCTIRYEIPTPGRVTLRVFDIVGKPVCTLVDGWREVGVYSEVWDGRGDDDSALPSGVYFYSIKAGDFVAMRKMVLLK
jgi:hypothetical protein